MRLLLDTNALLWLLSDDKRLGSTARQSVKDSQELVISEASLWEISIKISIGKLQPIPELLDTVNNLGFRRLNLKDEYLRCYESLPILHKDPFDRMLVAQASVEDITLLTSDTFLKNYGIDVLGTSWFGHGSNPLTPRRTGRWPRFRVGPVLWTVFLAGRPAVCAGYRRPYREKPLWRCRGAGWFARPAGGWFHTAGAGCGYGPRPIC